VTLTFCMLVWLLCCKVVFGGPVFEYRLHTECPYWKCHGFPQTFHVNARYYTPIILYSKSFRIMRSLLVEKPEGKRPLRRPRRKLVDNIMMNLGEIVWPDIVSIDLSLDRDSWRSFVNAVMNLRFS
jgi:hypothetical protein